MLGSAVALSVAGPFVAACALLVASGGGKLVAPGPAQAAARAAGVPAAPAVVFVFALAEIAAGGAGALLGGWAALAVAGCYVTLTLFAVLLLRRSPSTPCACLGNSRAVVGRLHVVIDVAAAAVALLAAFGPPPWAQVSGRWVAAAVFAILVACCARLAALALEALPALSAATKEGMS
jgi:hypothetical protein